MRQSQGTDVKGSIAVGDVPRRSSGWRRASALRGLWRPDW